MDKVRLKYIYIDLLTYPVTYLVSLAYLCSLRLYNYDKNIYSGLIEVSNNYYEIYKIYENVFPKITFENKNRRPFF